MSSDSTVRVPLANLLPHAEALVFSFRRGQHTEQGFILRVNDQLFAYVNRCPHWNVDLDLGDGPATYTRELNTMPQWAGSSWYFLRFVDANNLEEAWDPALEAYWMPVDL